MDRSWASVAVGSSSSKTAPTETKAEKPQYHPAASQSLGIDSKARLSEVPEVDILDNTNNPHALTAAINASPSSLVTASTRNLTTYPDHDDTLVVCIDVECHCRNPPSAEAGSRARNKDRRVCEIGIAVYDPSLLQQEELGDRAQNAWQYIKSYNLAIIEHKHRVFNNHPTWCKVGDANNFEFGETRWVRKDRAKQAFLDIVGDCLGESTAPAKLPHTNRRRIKWVYFAGYNDKTWLSSLDIDLTGDFPSSYVEDLQRGELSRSIARSMDKPNISAGDLCASLGLPMTGRHNGGNDAVWELRAFLAIQALTKEQFARAAAGYLDMLTG